jgi:alkanesulfonate monooxygenase SsuD/methylene tetrahydromethanopterin reductase-like flavin-dependent oxidoreductase (luciferase family)
VLDHLFWPSPFGECMTTLAVAAGATRSIPIGSCVLQLPLRRPAEVAKQAGGLALLCDGRLILGVGVGSHEGEYERAGVDYATRGIALDRGMESLRRYWQNEDEGPYAQLPAPPSIPIWVGGSSQPAQRRAGRLGDGWIPLFMTPAEYEAGLKYVRSEAEAAGRDGEIFSSVVVMATVGPVEQAMDEGTEFLSTMYSLPAKAFRRRLVAGPAEFVAESIGEYLDAGAEHVALMVCHDRAVEQFASVVEALGERAKPVMREMDRV